MPSLTLAEREEISRGFVAGHSIRCIAKELGRAAQAGVDPAVETKMAEASAWVFGDDNDFLTGKREQEPIYALEAHPVQRFRPGGSGPPWKPTISPAAGRQSAETN